MAESDSPKGQEKIGSLHSLELAGDPVAKRIGEAMQNVESLWRQINIQDRLDGGFDIFMKPDEENLASVEIYAPQIPIPDSPFSNTARIRNVVIHPPMSLDPAERTLIRVKYNEKQRILTREPFVLSQEAELALHTAQQFQAILPDGESTGWGLFAVNGSRELVKILDVSGDTDIEMGL